MPRWDFERRRPYLTYEVLSSASLAIDSFIRTEGPVYGPEMYRPLRVALQRATGENWPPDTPGYTNVFRNYERLLASMMIASAAEGYLQLLLVGRWLVEQQPSRQEFYDRIVEWFHYPNEAFRSYDEWLQSGRTLHPMLVIVRTLRELYGRRHAPRISPSEILEGLYEATDDLPDSVLGDAIISLRAGQQAPLLPRAPAEIIGNADDQRQVREIVSFLSTGGILHGDAGAIRAGSMLTLDDRYLLPQTHIQVAQRVRRPPRQVNIEFAEGASVVEGQVHEELCRTRQRNPRLRCLAIQEYGLTCHICGVDFSKYGDAGSSVVDVHHLEPLGGAAAPRQVTVRDVRITCAICHRLAHSQTPVLSVEQVRELLELE